MQCVRCFELSELLSFTEKVVTEIQKEMLVQEVEGGSPLCSFSRDHPSQCDRIWNVTDFTISLECVTFENVGKCNPVIS